ncbi:RluA family pseudouridine synthase [Odoribacter sp. OttesenSCG-928-G04]|nr:RluA family pseudouridine synthase [Odoribacter sp. OttesenSCG-928-G04]
MDDEQDEFLREDHEKLYEHHRIEADKGQELLRIDKFLMARLPHISRTKIQQAAEAGNILVNQISVKANYRVKPGDIVSVVLAYPKREIEIVPEDIPLDIVYEDESLMVINKKPGMVVHPAFGHFNGTLVNALAWHLKDNPMFQGDDFRPGLVHRIDKDTSGLLVIAKSEEAKTHLALQFFHKTSQRKYVAVCWGNLKEKTGTIIGHIGRHPVNRKVMSVYKDGSQGKSAITHYTVIESLGYVDMVECVLETGRTHQIRAHFKSIGHPLFNDSEYGGNDILKGTTFAKYKQFVNNCFETCPRQALHAKTLGFVHPATGEEMLFDSELPEDMANLIEKWRNYVGTRDEA